MTKNEVAQIVQDIYARKGTYVTEDDLKKAHIVNQFKIHFGKRMSVGLREIGVPCSPLAEKYNVTEEQLRAYLRELRDKLGFVPTTYEVINDKDVFKKYTSHPFTPVIFQKRFGGFPQALKSADLSENKIEHITSKGKKVGNKELEEFDHRRRFWGKGAELHVIAELLYRGFQPSNISVDEGVDVLANKNNKTYSFQVKHKDLSHNFPVELTKSTYQNKSGSDYFLVVVLLSAEENERKFLIIPWAIIDDWIDEGVVEDSGNKYLLHVRKIDNTFKLKNETLSRYLGNDGWQKIK